MRMPAPAPLATIALALGIAGWAGAAIAATQAGVRRQPAVPADLQASAPTPPGPRARPRNAASPRPLPASSAGRLAAPACAQYAAARAGRFPEVVLKRGAGLALAVVTESAASTLLGLPIEAPPAAAPARRRLAEAHARLARALAAPDDRAAKETAGTAAPLISVYAGALGITDCG